MQQKIVIKIALVEWSGEGKMKGLLLLLLAKQQKALGGAKGWTMLLRRGRDGEKAFTTLLVAATPHVIPLL